MLMCANETLNFDVLDTKRHLVWLKTKKTKFK